MNRRIFLMSSAAAAASKPARSANDTVRVACVGLRGRGRDHIRGYAELPNVEIAALCDVDESVLETRLADVEKLGKKRPAAFVDFRKLIEDKSIDAVSIATQNHNHTLQTIWACQAGKDVYVEKPCSHNMFESRQIVAAARKYDRIVQHGSQSRSSAGLREGFQKMSDGLIGDVYMARGLCYKWRDTIGRTAEEAVPAGVHYDLWLGPARARPFTRNRFHYNWHWFWDYGNGDIGNQGIHQMDVARWGLGVTYPVRVSAMGGHFMFDDDQETPNTMVATFEFNGAGRKKMLVFEVRHWISNREAEIGASRPNTNVIGNLFYGAKGYMTVEGGYKTFLGKEQAPGPSARGGGESHYANFLAAVRARNRNLLNAEIEEGAISTTLVHLANISYRLGRTLEFDAETMTCRGDSEANRLFTRDYRKPFVVPEKV
ncbi:MAG: Gfo/Idh/MocA family oxidoreductase [Bryobacteraceae bacterium]|nr:Gfo/Idh/MocA family oxidoreductase [Bryobacteraceae bacterium]